MTRDEAKQALIEGKHVTHDYYTPEEYLFLNEKGRLETEDGCIHGTFLDEFWTKYQIWETGWSIKLL